MTDDKMLPIKLIITILALGALFSSCSSPNEPTEDVISGIGAHAVLETAPQTHYKITVWVDTTRSSDNYIEVDVVIGQGAGIWSDSCAIANQFDEPHRYIVDFNVPPGIGQTGDIYTVTVRPNNPITIERTLP